MKRMLKDGFKYLGLGDPWPYDNLLMTVAESHMIDLGYLKRP